MTGKQRGKSEAGQGGVRPVCPRFCNGRFQKRKDLFTMYDFDKVVDRRGTSSIKWNFQNSFGQQSGLLPYWIADTDFATAPEVVQALQKLSLIHI